MSQLRQRSSTIARAIADTLGSGSCLLFLGSMVGNAVAYGYQMILSRLLSPTDYGTLTTLTSAFYILAVFWRAAQGWIIDAVAGAGGLPPRPPEAVLGSAMRTLLPLGAFVLVAHWLGREAAAQFLHLGSPIPILMLGLYVSTTCLLPIAIGIPLGINQFTLASGALILESLTRLLAGVIFVILGLGVSGALGGFVVGNIAAFATTIVVLRPLLAARRLPRSAKGSPARTDSYALFSLLANTCLMAIVSIDQVVVKHYFSGEVAGNYAVAFLLGRVISMSTMSLAWVIFARSATMPINDASRPALLIKGLAISGAIAIAMTAIYTLAPDFIVRVLGGGGYSLARGYVALEGTEMTLFSLLYVQVYYLISVRKMQVVWPLAGAVLLEIAFLATYHSTVQQVLLVLNLVMGGLLLAVSALSWALLRDRNRDLSVASVMPRTPR